MSDLFAPGFGNSLTNTLLKALKKKEFPDISFDCFSSFSSTGQPMDPTNSEVFEVGYYLPELQFAPDLALSGKYTHPLQIS